MIQEVLYQFQIAFYMFKVNFPIVSLIIILLWGIHLLNWSMGYKLNVFGIYPRNAIGLPGIFISPFLHGSANHLLFNSIPLFVLMSFVLIGGQQTFLHVSFIIIGLGGFLVWLFGRKAIHIGASGLVMGYWAYLLVNAYFHESVLTAMLAIISVYYFGGLLLNLFPVDARTSWEGHLFGFIAGIVAVFFTSPIKL